MSQKLGLEEALDIAMDAELKAQAFYAQAAIEVQDPHGRDLLGRLAAFEQYHYQKLSELIDDLSDRQQTAVRALLSGMPVEEIADRTASNRNAVYKLVHDARTKLKSGLEAAGYSAEDLTGSLA